jgi:hypothetical protein
MSKAEEYRARAAQCKSRAEETTDPDFRREFENLAERWSRFASQEEDLAGLDAQNPMSTNVRVKTEA